MTELLPLPARASLRARSRTSGTTSNSRMHLFVPSCSRASRRTRRTRVLRAPDAPARAIGRRSSAGVTSVVEAPSPSQPQTVAGYMTDRAALVGPGTGDHLYAPPRSQGGSPTRRMAPLLLNDLKQGFHGVDPHSYTACRADCSRLPEFGTVQRMDQPASALTATLPGTLVV